MNILKSIALFGVLAVSMSSCLVSGPGYGYRRGPGYHQGRGGRVIIQTDRPVYGGRGYRGGRGGGGYRDGRRGGGYRR